MPFRQLRSAPIRQVGAKARWKPLTVLHLWHLSSLDAPTVAVIWALGFAWAARIQLANWVLLLLGLITWTFYVGDRLFDARADYRTALRDRHIFHWHHRRIFAPLAIASALAAAAIIFCLMPGRLRQHDSLLGVAALAYFSGVHSRTSLPPWLRPFLSKESLVALIFTAGCALPAVSQAPIAQQTFLQWLPLVICIAFFVLLAWLNCRAIADWESPSRGSRVFCAGTMLGAAGLILAVCTEPFQSRAAALVGAGAASALLLALLDRKRKHFAPLTLRAAADLVLLTPVFLFLR